MKWRRFAGLLVVILAVILIKAGQETYRWFAYADERAELREMTVRLEDAGLEVVRTQLAADTLRAVIDAADARLDELRQRIEEYEKWSEDGTLPLHLHRAYTRELDRYNEHVARRNSHIGGWEEVVSRNHEAVSRYNRLADSLRNVAAGMGEPYYPIPTPVEVAVGRGLLEAGSP